VLLCVRGRHGSAALLPLHRRPGFQTALDPPDISTHAAAKPECDPLEEVVAVASIFDTNKHCNIMVKGNN